MLESRMGIRLARIAAGAAVLALASLAPLRATFGQDEISSAEAAAKAGADTAEGKKFGEALGQAFGRDHGSTIQRCARETKRPDRSDFELLVRVDGSGVVDQALVKPATNLATCVKDRMPGWKVSTPPQAGFWVKVGVTLKSR